MYIIIFTRKYSILYIIIFNLENIHFFFGWVTSDPGCATCHSSWPNPIGASQRLIWISRFSLLQHWSVFHKPLSASRQNALTPSFTIRQHLCSVVERERYRPLQLPATSPRLPSSPSNPRGPFILSPVPKQPKIKKCVALGNFFYIW